MSSQTFQSSQESDCSSSESRALLQTVSKILTKLSSKSEAAGVCLNEVQTVLSLAFLFNSFFGFSKSYLHISPLIGWYRVVSCKYFVCVEVAEQYPQIGKNQNPTRFWCSVAFSYDIAGFNESLIRDWSRTNKSNLKPDNLWLRPTKEEMLQLEKW